MAADVRADGREEALTDTIFALSSGAPPAAVAVVRISGPNADAALSSLAGRLPEPRRASLSPLRWNGELLDHALVLRFPGPNTATGEDLVELHLHGGRAVVAAVLDALTSVPGLRPAEPGEFTRRAFENGRVDLAEAEGLADLLAAETESQRRNALAAASGALGRQVEEWQATLLRFAAMVEAELDFGDEDDVAADQPWRAGLCTLIDDLDGALARPPAERLRDGVRVVIAGPPNAGKSSLLNALVGREAAIATPIAGTTRDVIEVPVAISGTPFLFLDTAGLRAAEDQVEGIGIARAEQAIAGADIVLWLGDPAAAPDGAVIVQSKSDADEPRPGVRMRVSALKGDGLSELIAALLERAKDLLPREGEVSFNARQRAAVSEALLAMRDAAATQDLLIAAESLRIARHALDSITGRAGVEDMLDALFGRFCIGK